MDLTYRQSMQHLNFLIDSFAKTYAEQLFYLAAVAFVVYFAWKKQKGNKLNKS